MKTKATKAVDAKAIEAKLKKFSSLIAEVGYAFEAIEDHYRDSDDEEASLDVELTQSCFIFKALSDGANNVDFYRENLTRFAACSSPKLRKRLLKALAKL